MVVIILLASRKPVMRAFTAPGLIITWGWIITLVMGSTAIRMLMAVQ